MAALRRGQPISLCGLRDVANFRATFPAASFYFFRVELFFGGLRFIFRKASISDCTEVLQKAKRE